MLVESEYLATSSTNYHRIFSSGGLTIEQILPYSKWRITFNGLVDVKKPDEQDDTDDIESKHIAFSFLCVFFHAIQKVLKFHLFYSILFTHSWFAASDPLNRPNNWSSKLLSRAFGHVEQLEFYLNDL